VPDILPRVAGRSGPAKGTPAIALLTRERITHQVHAYHHDPRAESYGAEAAAALGVAVQRCFKTLVVQADTGLAVAVVPVGGSLDLKALAGALGGKRASMADPGLAERTTGYVLGGISPLGQRKRLPTVIDASAAEHETIFVSAGRRGLEIELAPTDLVRLTDAAQARIAAP